MDELRVQRADGTPVAKQYINVGVDSELKTKYATTWPPLQEGESIHRGRTIRQDGFEVELDTEIFPG